VTSAKNSGESQVADSWKETSKGPSPCDSNRSRMEKGGAQVEETVDFITEWGIWAGNAFYSWSGPSSASSGVMDEAQIRKSRGENRVYIPSVSMRVE